MRYSAQELLGVTLQRKPDFPMPCCLIFHNGEREGGRGGRRDYRLWVMIMIMIMGAHKVQKSGARKVRQYTIKNMNKGARKC